LRVPFPTWSEDGRTLLYASHDGLWLADPATGNATEIEHPLYRESAWKHIATTGLAYYGQLRWNKQFSWYSGRAERQIRQSRSAAAAVSTQPPRRRSNHQHD
jgi:hypothetical protein